MGTLASSLVETLRASRGRRGPLLGDARTTAWRVVNAEADGVPDVTADVFGDVYVISLYRDFTPDEEETLLDAAVAAWAPRSLYLKTRRMKKGDK